MRIVGGAGLRDDVLRLRPRVRTGTNDNNEEFGSTGSKTGKYLHRTGATELLGFNNPTRHSCHRDGLGSVTSITNAIGPSRPYAGFPAYVLIAMAVGLSALFL